MNVFTVTNFKATDGGACSGTLLKNGVEVATVSDAGVGGQPDVHPVWSEDSGVRWRDAVSALESELAEFAYTIDDDGWSGFISGADETARWELAVGWLFEKAELRQLKLQFAVKGQILMESRGGEFIACHPDAVEGLRDLGYRVV